MVSMMFIEGQNKEYFQIAYAGFSFEDQNGESHEFDENGKEI